MITNIEKTTRLALVLTMCDTTARQNGRLDGLLNRLKKETNKQLRELPQVTQPDIYAVKSKIDAFSEASGWTEGKVFKTLTWCNFLLTILDDMPKEYGKIIGLINQIVEFHERKNKNPAPCYWAAAVAAERYLMITG